GRRLWPVSGIWRPSTASTPAYSMATGPTPWPKKGRWHRVLGVQTPDGGEDHRHHGQPRPFVTSGARRTRQCHRYDLVARGPESTEKGSQRGWSGPPRRLSQPRWRL